MLTRLGADGILAEMIETGGTFDPAATWVGIGSALANNGVNTVTANITEDTTNYPRQAITTWGTPYVLADGSAVVDSTIKIFVPPDNVHPTIVVVTGLFSALTAGNLLKFDAVYPPISLSTTLDHWNLVVRLRVDPAGQWDVSVSWNG
jgi:hypothetical protein